MDEYITEIRIPEGCKFIGKKVGEIEAFTEDRLTIIAGISMDENIYPPRHAQTIKRKDQFQIKADPVDLKIMMDEYGLRLIRKMRERIDMLKDEDTTFKEVLEMPDSPLLGRDRRFFRRRTSNTLILMAVSRQDQPIRKRLGEVIFRVGDVLLLQGNMDNLDDNISLLNLVPLAQREVQVGVFSQVSLALFIFGVAISGENSSDGTTHTFPLPSTTQGGGSDGKFWIRMQRDTASQFKIYIYNDEAMTSQNSVWTTTDTSLCQELTDLRYLNVYAYQQNSDSWTNEATLDDVKVYNATTSTAAVYPNLTNGAIFEESDTGKHYMFDGTSAWNEIT